LSLPASQAFRVTVTLFSSYSPHESFYLCILSLCPSSLRSILSPALLQIFFSCRRLLFFPRLPPSHTFSIISPVAFSAATFLTLSGEQNHKRVNVRYQQFNACVPFELKAPCNYAAMHALDVWLSLHEIARTHKEMV